jgi:hypothetical protein
MARPSFHVEAIEQGVWVAAPGLQPQNSKKLGRKPICQAREAILADRGAEPMGVGRLRGQDRAARNDGLAELADDHPRDPVDRGRPGG